MGLVSTLDDPVIAGRVHAAGVVLWVGMVPVSVFTGWITSVAYVSALSIAALAIGHWSAREAATAQRDLAEQLDRLEGKLDALGARLSGVHRSTHERS